jgi:circadian clock protein KaiC
LKKLARLSSGIEGLDQILDGGFVQSAAYIIQGRPGAGKTILSNQVAFSHARAGGSVLYVTLLAETHERLFQAMSTLDFFDNELVGRSIRYVGVFQTLRNEGLDAVVQLLRRETERHRATLLIFDGLLNARERADTDLDVKTFVANVQAQAAFAGCTVLFLTSTRRDVNSAEHTMVDGVIELSESVFGVRSVRQLQIRKSRGSSAIGGLHQYEIGESGISVYPRLETIKWPPVADRFDPRIRVRIGIDRLDAMVGGGLPNGSVTALIGATGTGKTSIGLHFLGALEPGRVGIHFGFFESEELLRQKAAALEIALPGSDRLHFICNPLRENLLDRLGRQLIDAVTRHRAKRVFIDGLGGLERAATERERLVEFFSVLTRRLRELGVTSIFTWEWREIVDRSVTAPTQYMSALFDNVIILRHFEQEHDLTRTIAIEKMRDSAFDTRTYTLAITGHGIQVGDPMTDIADPLPPSERQRPYR